MIILPETPSSEPSAIRSYLIQRVPNFEKLDISLRDFGDIVRENHTISNADLGAIHRAARLSDDLTRSYIFTNTDKIFGRGAIQQLQSYPFRNQFAYTYEYYVYNAETDSFGLHSGRIDSEFLLSKGEFQAIVGEQFERLEENADAYDLTPQRESLSLTGIFSR